MKWNEQKIDNGVQTVHNSNNTCTIAQLQTLGCLTAGIVTERLLWCAVKT